MARTPKGRALGAALRKAREDRGLKLRGFSAKIGRDPAVLSRWETGERTPKPEDVAQYLTALGVNGDEYEQIISLAYDTDAPLWVATSLPEQRRQLAAYVDLEQNATTITDVSPTIIPGLLQTTGYIRAVMSGGDVSAEEIATRITVRIGRRDVITRAEPANLVAMIGEGAIRQIIGSREIMVEQLRHLESMARRVNVEVRLVPYDSGWSPALEGAFSLIESNTTIPVVMLEARTSGLFLYDGKDVDAYKQAVDMIDRVALSCDESLALIAKTAEQMELET